MAINPNPLEQRLDTILPDQPVPQADPVSTEQAVAPVTEMPGDPAMEPVQVAGLGSALRGIVGNAVRKAGREVVPQPAKAAADALPQAGKVGNFKVIPEAPQALVDKVDAAAQQRRVTGNTIGKPSRTTEEVQAGIPQEPFNLARYQTDDAAAIVGGVADALGIKTKRVTFDEIKAKAAESGINEAFLSRLVNPQDGKMLPSAVDTYKALEVLESSANELDRLFKMVADGTATDVDKLKLRQQIALHGMIQRGVKGIQTETARALAVFRIPRQGNADIIRRTLDEFGGEGALQDMARSYLSLESRAAKNQLVEKSMMSGIKDVWFTTWINGLLSSPVSHAKNIVSNSLFGVYQIPERLVGAFYGNTLPARLRRGLVPGAENEKVGFDEALTMMQSLRNGLGEGLELASRAWRTNSPNDPLSKIELTRGTDAPPISSAAFGIEQDKWLGKGIDYYGTAITLPGRALMTEDEFFKGVLYRMELNAQAIRRGKTVYRDALDQGADEATAVARAESEVTGIMSSPPPDIDEAALNYARRGTFTMDLPPGLQKLQGAFNHPIGKVMVPFFRTPANIGLEVLERTPFAPLSGRFRDEIAQGGIYRDMALAKVTMGSAVLATFASYAAEGKITGSGPSRKADREALMRDGWQPYSIKVGDTYYSYAGMEPVSALLAIAADYAEYAQTDPDDSKVQEVFLGGVQGLYEYMKEQPYLQGIADFAKLLGGDYGPADINKVVDNLAKQYGGFLIGGSPAGAYSSLVAAIERMRDPTQRDYRMTPDAPSGIKGFYESFNKYRSRLPYYSEDLPPALNLWGDPVLQGRGNVYEMVLPTRVSPVQFSVVDDLLVRMGSPIGMPDRKLDGVELDATQYNRLLTIYGKELNAKGELEQLLSMPGFDLLPLDEQQKAVRSAHDKLINAARSQLRSEDPTLDVKVMDLEELRRANGMFYKP